MRMDPNQDREVQAAFDGYVKPSQLTRYFMAQDNDSHWYVVPVDREEDWEKWLSIDVDDERSWEAPDFARSVGGAPRLVTFANPEIK